MKSKVWQDKMIIWVLVIVSNVQPLQIFVNSFSTQAKCEQRIKEMEPIYKMSCVKTFWDK